MRDDERAHLHRITEAWNRIRRKRPAAPLHVFRAMLDHGEQPETASWTEDQWVRWVVETFRTESSEPATR